jgi:hypothetical protein
MCLYALLGEYKIDSPFIDKIYECLYLLLDYSSWATCVFMLNKQLHAGP